MSKIILCYRINYQGRRPVETYSRSVHAALESMGHEVLPIGEGHPQQEVYELSADLKEQFDLFIDMDCGRNGKGHHHFQNKGKLGIPTAVWFIDSHGHPTLHKRFSRWYDHVFFAVWSRRELFKNHKSAHWLPNASDSKWFNYGTNLDVVPKYVIGFFGSKGGIDRADVVKEVAENHSGWSYDIREIGREFKNRWPRTGDAMANCQLLFNKGQKHDGPNQRVFESMLMNRPLITFRDKTDGMTKLFEEGEHYLGWESPSELANQIAWCLTSQGQATSMAKRAYEEVIIKHQVKNRVAEMLEVTGVK